MSDLTPGCDYCADGQRDGFGGDERCGYCGRFYDTPDDQHWPYTGICCGNDWWVQEVKGGWSVTLKGPYGGEHSPVGVMTEQPTVEALRAVLTTDTDDLEVKWWTTTKHRQSSTTEQPTPDDLCLTCGEPNDEH